MNSQKYNRKIRIEQDGEVQDASGAWVTGWQPVAEVWANVQHGTGSEAIRGNASVSKVEASIRIRYRDDVTAGMRIIVIRTGSVYNITQVKPDLQALLFVDLVCEVVT